MSNYLSISSLSAKVPGSDSYVNVDSLTPTKIKIDDAFSLKLTIKNNSTSHGFRTMSVALRWMNGSTIVKTKWLAGTGPTGDKSKNITDIEGGHSGTFYYTGISPRNSGLDASLKSSSIRVDVWVFSSSGSVSGNKTESTSNISFLSEVHNLTVDIFDVYRLEETHDNTTICMDAQVSRDLPENPEITDSVKLQYKDAEHAEWTDYPYPEDFDLDDLLYGVQGLELSMELGATDWADFRLIFYNPNETSTAVTRVGVVFVNVHLSGTGSGVAFGGYCDEEGGKFKCHLPAVFEKTVQFKGSTFQIGEIASATYNSNSYTNAGTVYCVDAQNHILLPVVNGVTNIHTLIVSVNRLTDHFDIYVRNAGSADRTCTILWVLI